MMIRRFVTAAILLLLNTPIVFAQTKTYSLPEVWQNVLQHYPSLTAKKEAVEAQALLKKLTKEGFLPDMAVQAQQSYGSNQNVPGSFFPLPGLYNTSGANKTTDQNISGFHLYSSALLQWNFLQFGRRRKKLDAADAAINISNSLLKQEELSLLSTATRLYFSALANTAALGVASAESQRFSSLLELLQAKVAAGLRPGADTLLLKASLLQSKTKEHDFSMLLKTRLIQLSSLMGGTDTTIAVDTTLFNRFKQTAITTSEALQNHPSLQVMNARIHAAEADRESIKKELYPSIGLLAGVGLKGSTTGTDGSVIKDFSAPWQHASGTWLAGVGLTWNFSSLYQNKTRRAAADRTIAAAKAEKEATQFELAAQYASALAGWDEQRQKLASAYASLNASKQAYELYEVRYQSGLLSLIEVLQLQKTLHEAESNYVTAISTYWNELLNQAEMLGDPYFILNVIEP